MTAFITKECPTLMIQEKKSKVVFIALFSLLIFLVLHQTSPAITQVREILVYTIYDLSTL